VDRDELSLAETELLIDCLSDDVSFNWALIDLGLRANPPDDDVPPSLEMIAAAFARFDRLLTRQLIKLGRVIYADPNQPRGTVGPVKHVSEPIAEVRQRVEQACSDAIDWSDWAFCCWIVTTDAGDAIARTALEGRS
jgi:hypothetical protein